MAGTPTWFAGRRTCLRYLGHVIGSPGDWLMIPSTANGQPAAVTYHREGDGSYHAFGIAILTVTTTGIARITVFGGGVGLVRKFGLPPVHPERRR
jgi:RNA polymerase sigma-70 factor (ECF subfamily)